MKATQNTQTAVVGVDFSPSSDEAIQWGMRWLEEAKDRVLHLVHVLDPRDIVDNAEVPALFTADQVLAEAPARLWERTETLTLTGNQPIERARVRTHAQLGKAVEALLQICVDYEADVLVVGTHGRRGMERVLLGSVSEQLVRSARCPVIVARRKDYAGCEKTPRPDPAYAPDDPRAHPTRKASHEPILSTTSDNWEPSDTAPTGIRIV